MGKNWGLSKNNEKISAIAHFLMLPAKIGNVSFPGSTAQLRHQLAFEKFHKGLLSRN